MFVHTLIITVLAALAAPSLAEESAAVGTQAQDAVAAASAVETMEKNYRKLFVMFYLLMVLKFTCLTH